MADNLKLTHPWLVAVWPGMGHVALNGGVYMLAKLGIQEESLFLALEIPARHRGLVPRAVK